MKDPRARAALDRGDWAAAAALLEEEGENAEAAALYARLLDFAAAARCQLRAGAPDAALDAAAAGGNRQLEAEVLREVLAISPPAVLERAAARMEERHRPELAAPLWDAAGLTEAAAAAFEAAGDLAGAARRWLRAGDHRAAGRLLEKHLEAAPRDLAARLELGSVLARFGRHEVATAMFREAAADVALAPAALRKLALSFAAQGHPHAAEAVLEELAAVAPDAPRDLLGLAALEGTGGAGARDRGGVRIQSRYVLVSPRSASSLGDTYLAWDEFEDVRVCLTLFRPAVAQSRALRRFAASVRAAHALELPWLLPLVEFNLANGFMATSLPAGPALEDWLRRGSVRDADGILRAAGGALHALHRRGLLHGALNVANLFVSDGGGVQLAEVGSGVLIALRETESQGLQTSLATLAPEIVAGGEPTAAADQYALAALAFHFATGRWPQPSGTPRWQPPSRLGAPAALDAPLARALAPRPADRFPDVDALLAALPALPGAASPAPVSSPLEARTGSRFVDEHHRREAGGVCWVRARDAVLEREVVLGTAAPGGLASLAPLAALGAGTDHVLEFAPDGTRVVLEVPRGGSGAESQRLRDWAAACDAVAVLHDAALCLEPGRTERLRDDPPRVALADLPPPRGGGPEERAADLQWLTARVAQPAATGTPREMAAALRALAAELERAEAAGRVGAGGAWRALLDDTRAD